MFDHLGNCIGCFKKRAKKRSEKNKRDGNIRKILEKSHRDIKKKLDRP